MNELIEVFVEDVSKYIFMKDGDSMQIANGDDMAIMLSEIQIFCF